MAQQRQRFSTFEALGAVLLECIAHWLDGVPDCGNLRLACKTTSCLQFSGVKTIRLNESRSVDVQKLASIYPAVRIVGVELPDGFAMLADVLTKTTWRVSVRGRWNMRLLSSGLVIECAARGRFASLAFCIDEYSCDSDYYMDRVRALVNAGVRSLAAVAVEFDGECGQYPGLTGTRAQVNICKMIDSVLHDPLAPVNFAYGNVRMGQ